MFPAVRWCLIANIIWLTGVAGFVWQTYVSAERHLTFADTWTPKIAKSNDLETQKQLNLQLLKAVDNRVAAVKALQRRAIGFGTLAAALGSVNFAFLLVLHRCLRREVHFTIETA